MPKRTKKTVLNSESREFVVRLRDYFEREYQNGGPLLPISQVGNRVAEALGIGRSTVSRISKEKFGETSMEEKKLSTPNKKRRKISPVTNIDSFDADAIRTHVYAYYIRRELPTLSKLAVSLKHAKLFKGSLPSLSTVLKSIGFMYKKSDKRKIIMERADIALARVGFLRKVKKIENWDKVVFLDETWLNANHTVSKIWTDDTAHSSTKVPQGKGQRLIITHAGTSAGFVANCLLAFKSTKTTEYHEEMNFDTFKKWFENLLDNLDEPHFIIMDNAPYHSVQKDKPPTTANRKFEIVERLNNKGIEANENLLKKELLRLVSLHKPRTPTYVLDELAAERGHTVIRLSPYHCHYNAIELIWAQVKVELCGETWRGGVARSPSHESVTTELSLFSVSSAASDARVLRLLACKAGQGPDPALRGASPNPDGKSIKRGSALGVDGCRELLAGCAALCAQLGLRRSFSAGDVSGAAAGEQGNTVVRGATSEMGLCAALEALTMNATSRSYSTWVAVGGSQLPSPQRTQPNQPLKHSLIDNKKVRQSYIKRRLLTTYRALERMSQSEFNLDRLEAAAVSAVGSTAPPAPPTLLVPTLPPVGRHDTFLHPEAARLALTAADVERERGRPLSKYERNMMIFNWLHTLDDNDSN